MLGDPAGDVLPDQLLADFVDHLVPHSRMLLVLLIAAADPLKKLARRLGRGDPVLGAANDRDRQPDLRPHIQRFELSGVRLAEPPRGHRSIVQVVPFDRPLGLHVASQQLRADLVFDRQPGEDLFDRPAGDHFERRRL